MKEAIEIKNITKDYKNERGVFDINISFKIGDFCGVIGENGAGKTTLLRLIMGYIKATSGNILVNGLDVKREQERIHELVGYVPGEIGFPDLKNGMEFLNLQAEMDDTFNKDLAKKYIEKLNLDMRVNPRRMSKGMKQKLALINVFSRDKMIYILDEPSTGLDPLMRNHYLDILKEKKSEGKTIILTSNNFEEIENVCDRVVYLNKGRIIADFYKSEVLDSNLEVISVFFKELPEISIFKDNFEVLKVKKEKNEIVFLISKNNLKKFFLLISKLNAFDIKEHIFSMEEYVKFKVQKRYERKDI